MSHRLKVRWKQWRCEHFWRPSRSYTYDVGRICDYCQKYELLNIAQFYAQFGKIPEEYRGIFSEP